MNTTFEKAANFIWGNARLLEQAIFEYSFFNGSAERIRSILRCYQNEDGGFGHALEPDLRVPESHPLFVEFGLRTLYDCNIRDQEIAMKACDFLARHSDLAKGIAMVFSTIQHYPHADHMDSPGSQQPSMDRLVGLVGLVSWHGISHPWLAGAVPACTDYILAGQFTDAHTILTSFCLVESLAAQKPIEPLYEKLAADLLKADFFIPDAPITSYGLTPLVFAPSPTSFCRRIFTDAQIDAHLDDLLAKQQPDGGWPISWTPPGDMSRLEWRAQKTVSALTTLRSYGRL